jgi:Zn-dependent protease
VLALLVLNQLGILRLGEPGGGLGALQQQLPRWLALVVGITVHEFSHGLVATWFGDEVPRRAGRLTLNPLRHLDPLGTLMILVGPIGWGRPMPINPAGMRNPSLGWALSSAAGPISNLLVATATVLVVALTDANLRDPYVRALFSLNVGLAVFNLVPLPPLDGFGFVFGLAPRPLKVALAPIWQIGPLLLLGLLFLPEIVPGFPPILSNVLEEGISLVGRFLLEIPRAI